MKFLGRGDEVSEISKPELVRVVMQQLYCAEYKDFLEAFGDDGGYLWEKWVGPKKQVEADFICYLDMNNLAKLVNWAERNHLKQVAEIRGDLDKTGGE